MFSLLKRRPSERTASQRRASFRLHVEDLEGRALLSSVPINFSARITSPPVVMNGQLFFAAYDATHGYQLWKFNGSAASQVSDGHDAAGGLNPSHLTVVGNTFFFSGNDG